MKRVKLRLVGGSKKIKVKKIPIAVVTLVNDQILEFDMNEFDAYREEDWLEFEHKTTGDMANFYVGSVISVIMTTDTEKLAKAGKPKLAPIA